MPRDNQDTSPDIIETRHRTGRSQSTLNIELALNSNVSESQNSASASNVSVATEIIAGGIPPRAGCFVGETLIGLSEQMQIAAAKVGDFTDVFDPNTKEQGRARITQTFIHEVEDLLLVVLEGGTSVQVTPEHLFFYDDGFTAARNLEIGDCLYKNMVPVKILGIFSPESQKINVYNIETEWGTYFANGIAVHNLKDPDDE